MEVCLAARLLFTVRKAIDIRSNDSEQLCIFKML